MDASAETVKLTIEQTKNIGKVDVTRIKLLPCIDGCGHNDEHGFGYTWRITFLNIQVSTTPWCCKSEIR